MAITAAGAAATGDRSRSGGFEALTEASIIATTAVAAFGMSRLFVDTSFLAEVLGLCGVTHLTAAVARRTGLRIVVAILLTGGMYVVAATVAFYADTAWLVVPTASTVAAARADLEAGWDVLIATPAPVLPVPGLVLIAATALSVTAFLADTAACRLRTTAAAITPVAAIFLFAAAVGTGEGTRLYGTLFAATAATTMALLWLQNRGTDSWIEAAEGDGAMSLARAAGVTVLLAVVAGSIAGPRLPGADADPWIDPARLEVTGAAPWVEEPNNEPEPWADFTSLDGPPDAADVDDGGPRILVSPLVQVRSRLVDLSNRELFAVSVPEDQRQYWRLTSLDEFDGEAWRSRARYTEALGPLPVTLDPSAGRAPLVQTVSLSGLGNSYLPAAYELRQVVDDGGVGLQYEATSGSLIKGRQAALAGPDQFTYAVLSQVPVLTDPDRLRNVDTAALDDDFMDLNTGLPAEARALVTAEAQRITADAQNDYHRALLLQDHFRLDGGFRYDLNVHAAAGIDSLEDFLFEVRAGYCEQFSTAFAAMARSIGLPTRVAVGFTWGEWNAQRGAYVVRGAHAHAWPEVYFAETGWVRFEPTPGRGAPGDFPVTGQVADQAGPATVPPESPPDADVDDSSQPSGAPGQQPPAPAPGASPPNGGDGAVTEQAQDSNDLRILWLVLIAVLLAMMSVPLLREARRRRRRALLDGDPAGLINLWWNDTGEALELLRLAPRPTETPLESAGRITQTLPDVGPIGELAALTTHSHFARSTPDAMAERAGEVASGVIDNCRSRASLFRRLGAALNPSTLFRPEDFRREDFRKAP